MTLVLMGVTGSGKTTIGRGLARVLNCPFYDADDFHPAANKEKMGKGIPLTDEDRKPWLDALRVEMGKWQKNSSQTVLACSALKQNYRDLLAEGNLIQWIYLRGDQGTLRKRIEGRQGHFAGANLLKSQLETLEEPQDAIWIEIQDDPDRIVKAILGALKGKGLL